MIAFVSALVLSLPSALAWESHIKLMPAVLTGASPHLRAVLMRPLTPSCPSEDDSTYRKVAADLGLHPKGKPGPLSADACQDRRSITSMDILLSAYGVVDEPDHGMDRDLPDSMDLYGFRKWMGGNAGPHSQGFRHMYFAGWNWREPLSTFQIPTRALGEAPNRAALIAQAGYEFLKSGRHAWGVRLLGWAMHYLQDLAQPFHSAQIPGLRMVPWQALYHWPPNEAFSNLVHETTRTIGNYHWAYEMYVGARLAENERISPFAECLERAEDLSPLRKQKPKDTHSLATQIAKNSRQLAPKIGSQVMALFGPSLKLSSVDIPHGKGVPKLAEVISRPDFAEIRNALHQTTCLALADAVVGSRLLLEWVLLDNAN